MGFNKCSIALYSDLHQSETVLEPVPVRHVVLSSCQAPLESETMLRSGLILSVSGPAAILALVAQPMVRETADAWKAPIIASAPAVTTLAIIDGRVAPANAAAAYQTASLHRPTRGVAPKAPSTEPTSTDMQPAAKPRRMMRDGCEGAISSLAGPEARRMVPGRCIA